jgi:hypothetical protein
MMRGGVCQHRRSVVAVLLLCLQPWWVACASEPAQTVDDGALLAQFNAVAQTFDIDVQRTLADIEGLPRRLLALRAYLRAGDSLRSRWSWTEAEIVAFRASPGYQQMLADVQRITREVEQIDPAVTLYSNTEVRSLGVQLERWNKHRTVGLLADELLKAARSISAASTATEGTTLRQLLLTWQPSVAVPLAAPGLSLHGRGRALDFQIRKGDRIIAGTDVAAARKEWDASGWTEKLQRAVKRSGTPFRGPLRSPYEPWHYEYAPPAAESSSALPGSR